MKKILLTSTLLALASAASAGNFDRMQAGFKVNHAWSDVDVKQTGSVAQGDIGSNTLDVNAFGGDLFFGKGFMFDDLHVGLEATAGFNLGKESKSYTVNKPGAAPAGYGGVHGAAANMSVDVRTKRRWGFGFSGRVGKVMNDILVYGRLGFGLVEYEARAAKHMQATGQATWAVGSGTKSNYFWNVSPGVGAEFVLGNGFNARVEYNYEHYLTSKSTDKVGGAQFEWGPDHAHVLSLGLSVAI